MKNLKNLFTLLILVLVISCSKDSDTPPTTVAPVLAITAISPTTGPKNTPVTITGTGFSTTAGNNAVTLNGKVCPVVNSTATQLTISIPPSAGSGKIKVAVAVANAESGNFDFIVTTTVTTIAGSTEGSQDGQGSAAQFRFPEGIALDSQGNLLVTDKDKIRKISSTGLVTTVAGSTNGFLDGQSILAKFNGPNGITVTATDRIFVTDEFNHNIRLISNIGFVGVTAGSSSGIISSGFSDGFRFDVAKFDQPAGIAIDDAGALFIADKNNRRIRKIAGNNVTTLAGSGSFGSIDGQGNSASFSNPTGITIDAPGNLYITDNSKLIRKITPTGLVTTIAGSTSSGFADGQGSAAKFNFATGIAIDTQGNLFVSDKSRIRKISPTGLVTTIAGTAISGFLDGNATTAQFNFPNGIAIDAQGNLYISDRNNHKIRKITFD